MFREPGGIGPGDVVLVEGICPDLCAVSDGARRLEEVGEPVRLCLVVLGGHTDPLGIVEPLGVPAQRPTDEPGEDLTVTKPSINRRMIFNEICPHTLAFVAVGAHDAEGSTLNVQLINTDDGDAVLHDSGPISFEGGVANHQLSVSPV